MKNHGRPVKDSFRVLMATNALELGGAETHVIELSRGLGRLGCEVLVASSGGKLVSTLNAVGSAHYDIPLDSRAVITLARSFVSLLRLVKRERPDILHAHARIPAMLMNLVSRMSGVPLVTTVHWPFDVSGWKRLFTWWSPHSIVVSEDLRDYLVQNFGFEPREVAVIPNGVDTELFAPGPPDQDTFREFGWEPGDLVIVHVSRLTGSIAEPAFRLVRAVSALGREIPALRLLIAGDGDRREELEGLADKVNRDLGRSLVRVAGQRGDLQRLLPMASLFVGVSRAALEAMACARPVILAGSQGYLGFFTAEMLPEAIRTNFTGRGQAEVREEVLVNDLRRALTGTSSADRDLSGEFNRQVVDEFYSSRIMAEKTLSFYQAVVSGSLPLETNLN